MKQNFIRAVRQKIPKPSPLVSLRIPGALYQRIRRDLERTHPFAAERIGFLFTHTGELSAPHQLLLATAYYPVQDEHYIDDPSSGARIGSRAIREAMQRVLDGNGGAFHVHLHDHDGPPVYSRMDREEQPKLIASFRTVGAATPHGTLVLSRDYGIAAAWLPGHAEPVRVTRISVVGAPTQIWQGSRK